PGGVGRRAEEEVPARTGRASESAGWAASGNGRAKVRAPAAGLGEDRLRLLAGAEVRAGVRESAAPDRGAAARGKGQRGEHGADGPRVAGRADRSRPPRGQDAVDRGGATRHT